MAQVERRVSESVRVIFYDLGYPIAEEISDQQQLFEYGFLQRFLPLADGEFLDATGVFFGLSRNEGETDDAYRQRLIDRARTEEGDGRRQDYERWARNVDGGRRSRCHREGAA
ncbi:baseplate J/gp47 family protein [Brevibacillus porteri]|uniref:baseplate J/gp47 family protein n=1 Tax=Brevibacillus porteri TaxID=2126350 RepID=UPI0036283E64